MSIISEINSFIDLVARVKSWITERRSKSQPSTPAGRFIKLFEAHGIHRNQIPRYFPEALSLAVVQSDEKLSEVLDQRLIDSASQLFGVNPEWIECASSQVYQTRDFYKYPLEFLDYVDTILSKGSRLKGVVFTADGDSLSHEQDTFILLIESFETHEGLSLERYHILDGWHFDYGKSRAYLSLCVTAAWNRKAYIQGRTVSQEFIEKYSGGCTLLQSEVTESWLGKRWFPEDLGLDPAILIKNLPTIQDKETALRVVINQRAKDTRLLPVEFSIFDRVTTFQEALDSLTEKE
ncbi:hypothetical protein [Marinobacter sp. MIT932201]|uniref:hypothetical protein n=1 Tax=Marinobacter sp. MIT932201 TaxID=3096995 RepID=UPI00399A2F41